jgi:hypothetical protein
VPCLAGAGFLIDYFKPAYCSFKTKPAYAKCYSLYRATIFAGRTFLKPGERAGRMLSIAKESYIKGQVNAYKKTFSDSILAILNFDFAAETIIKATLRDYKKPLANRNGHPLRFEDLEASFTSLFPNINFEEVRSLHFLRNQVQHECATPSETEILRHNNTIRVFFDQVCKHAYDGSISYNDISLALFLKSANEKIIMEKMEEVLEQQDYASSVLYAKQAALYHVYLLRSSIEMPNNSSYYPLDPNSSNRKIGAPLRTLIIRQNWIIDKMYLKEHYEKIISLLGANISFKSAYDLNKRILRTQSSKEDAEKYRTQIYDFIISTQDQIQKDNPDISRPYIFDFLIEKTSNQDNYRLRVGFASIQAITASKVSITEKMPTRDPIDIVVEDLFGRDLKQPTSSCQLTNNNQTIDVEKTCGLHEICFALPKKELGYEIHFEITDEAGNTEFREQDLI